jgi:hypothetical protein
MNVQLRQRELEIDIFSTPFFFFVAIELYLKKGIFFPFTKCGR